MAIVYINGREIELADHQRANGIQAAALVGVDIPHYCWHAGLSVVASCRMCLVETGTRNPQTGDVVMLPKLVPACQTPAKVSPRATR
jgi:NADH-quinone oxidoreductase subunit G